MFEDKSNIYRVDLKDIYSQCEKRTAYKYRMISTEVDIDEFVITKQERQMIHEFGLLGASLIASKCSYVKTPDQTGLDALSYTFEDQRDEVKGRSLEQGEKLHQKAMPEILFNIEAVDTDVSRYTIIQQFIKEALICFILHKWYETLGFADFSYSEYMNYDKMLTDIRYNAVYNQKSKSVKRPFRILG